MADNITLDPGAAGATLAADEIASIHHQRVKVQHGADGSATDVSAASPLPIDDAAGSLTIDNDDTVSTNNSTTSTLAGDAIYTGTGDDCLGYTSVAITLKSSHDSATDGMTFQFSPDNSNWDDVNTFTYSATNGARRFQFPVTARYFRVVYTNGGTTQTVFRVQTILFRQNLSTSIHRLADDVNPDRSTSVVKSIIFAQAAGTGDFMAVDATAGGNLMVSIEEFDAGASLPAGDNNIGNVDIVTQPADTFVAEDGALGKGVLLQGDDGTDRKNVNVDATTGDVQVDVTNTVTVSGTVTAIPAATGAGTEAAAQRVTIATDSTGLVSVDDNDGSLTVDGTVTVTHPALGAGTEAGAQRVTLATDSTGLLSIDDNGGSLTIDNDDTVSTNNSSTSTLANNAIFTGTGDDCLGYSTITVTTDSSHDAATDGMSLQFSTDNSNWDDVYPFDYHAADGARRFQLPVTARYFRLVYTNGGTTQTHFRLQTILHRQNLLTSIHRLKDDIHPDRSAAIAKSVIFAQAAGSGDFVAIDATAGGNLKVAIEEFDTSLPAGTNNIGDVDVLTAPARDRTTDNIGVAEDASSLMDDTTVLTVKRANIAVDGSGNQALIAAVADKTLRIVSMMIFTDAAVDVYFNDGTADLVGDATHLIKLDNTGAVGIMGFMSNYNPKGWFETAAVNRPININLSAVSKNIAGTISYVEV